MSKESLRLVLWAIVNFKLESCQYNVCTAFLNGDIDVEMYIELPSIIFSKQEQKQKVARLNKSLYGLKQSPLLWNQTISLFFETNQFLRCSHDPCVYRKGSSALDLCIIALYVDDFIIAAPSIETH